MILRKIRIFFQFLQQENLLKIVLILLMLVIVSAAGIAFFERNMHYSDALWWSIVTLTTVGYGDISPVTTGGRVMAGIIMFLGIGLLGMFTASIASIFVDQKMKKDRGMSSYDFQNHIIICEWNSRAREVLKELRSDTRCAAQPVILIAEVDIKPVDDENLFFIRGETTEENLEKANIKHAKTVIIIGDERLNQNPRDAKAVLTTLAVESINPQAYTIVELADESNIRHCERANADEIIVGAEFSSKLISRAALNHGISKVISELLTSKVGNDLLKIPVPAPLQGTPFLHVFTEMKRIHHSIVLGLQKSSNGQVFSNPSADQLVEAGDHLIVIATSRKEQSSSRTKI